LLQLQLIPLTPSAVGMHIKCCYKLTPDPTAEVILALRLLLLLQLLLR
jgi:hypothetical protein